MPQFEITGNYKIKLKMKRSKATVCVNRACVTVFDDAAKLITALVVIGTAILAISAVSKALKG